MGCSKKTPNDAKKVHNHTSSLVATAMDLYSASANDLETVACFLVFHEISDPPRQTKYLVTRTPVGVTKTIDTKIGVSLEKNTQPSATLEVAQNSSSSFHRLFYRSLHKLEQYVDNIE